MKRSNNRIFLIMFLAMMMTMLVILPTSLASTTTTYNETFESPDTHNAAPSSNWYTFSDGITTTGAKLGANVTNKKYLSGTQSFDFNSSNGLNKFANFTFDTADAYNGFLFAFRVNNTNHQYAYVKMLSGTSNVVQLNITSSLVIGHINGNGTASQVLQNKIINNTWYLVAIYFNWNNNVGDAVDLCRITITNGTSAVVMNTSAWTSISSYDTISEFQISGKTDQKVQMYFDTLYMYITTYTSQEQTTNYLTQYIIPTVISVAIMGIIISIAITTPLTIESSIILILIVVFGIVTITIIMGL